MREAQLVRQGDLVAAASSIGSSRPLPDAVERQDGCLFIWRREKGAGGVRLVVVGENVATLVLMLEPTIHFPWQVELLAEPERHGLQERLEADRHIREVGLDQPLELDQRLVIERNEIELGRGDP